MALSLYTFGRAFWPGLLRNRHWYLDAILGRDGDNTGHVWLVLKEGEPSPTSGCGGPTGQQLSVWGIDIFRIEDGKIAEWWVIDDNLGMMEQLGVFSSQGQSDEASPT